MTSSPHHLLYGDAGLTMDTVDDANDNADRAELEDIDPNDFDHHWDTPASVELDAKGREIRMVERVGADEDDWYVTEMEYDIRDNVISVTDPLGRKATEKVYDLRDEPIRSESIDAGTSLIVHDASGTPVESRDARGAWELTVKDALLRPILMWGQDSQDEKLRLTQHIVYGDDAGLSDPENDNLVGKPYIHRDEAGRCEFESYDFTGELLEKVREVIDPQLMIDAYENADSSIDYEVDTFRVNWEPDAGEGDDFEDREDELLDGGQEYRVSSTFDALGRSKSVTYPEDVDAERKELKPTYNAAGNLKSIQLDGDTYVEHIAYNPKGQRIVAAFGNGVMTRYC